MKKFRKVKMLTALNWKHAGDIIGEPAVMAREMLKSEDGLHHIIEVGDQVWLDLRILIYGKEDHD